MVVINLPSRRFTKRLEEKEGLYLFTEILTNRCGHRSHDLAVLAVHSVSSTPIMGIEEEGGYVYECIPDLSKPINAHLQPVIVAPVGDWVEVEYAGRRWKARQIVAAWQVGGNFRVTPRERPGKLLVLHLNQTTEQPNALWVMEQSGGLHQQCEYRLMQETSTAFADLCLSGGGSTSNAMLVGALPFGARVEHYWQSYKGRQGDRVSILEATPEGLRSLEVALADGLVLDDLKSPEEG